MRSYRIFVFVVAALISTGANAEGPIGLTPSQLIQCAGLPQGKMTEGGSTFFQYSRSRTSGWYSGTGTAQRFGNTVFGNSDGSIDTIKTGCDAVVTIRGGRVVSVNYKKYGGLLTREI